MPLTLRWMLLLAYPALAHSAIYTGSRALMALALATLIIAAGWRTHDWRRIMLALVAVGAAIALAAIGSGFWLMAALSLGLPCIVVIEFLHSLAPGNTPLISIIAEHVEGPLSPPVARYTRHLTQLWAFAILVLMSVELALLVWGTHLSWSRYANGYVYGAMAAIFIGEYAFRRWHFRHMKQPSTRQYLRAILSPTSSWH